MSLELRIEKSAPSHTQIESYLQRQIRSGTLKAGDRLPPNMELARKWSVSCTAVQRALANLTSAGLVDRSPRRGTFVKPHTEKANIGVLVGPNLGGETAHFHRAVIKALRSEIDSHGATCRVYDALSGFLEGNETHRSQIVRQLETDFGSYAFKGLIQISPDPKWPRQLDRMLELPQVIMAGTRQKTDCKMDTYQFGRDAIRYLAGRGHRRIVYLRNTWHLAEHSDDLDGILDEVRAAGLAQPHIEQVVTTKQGHQLEREIEERMERLLAGWNSGADGQTWPDALVVNDDIMMRGVALALIRNGVRVPERIRVLCHANEEVRLHYGLPVVRLTYSTADLARALADLLWKRLQGEPEPPLPILIKGKIDEAQT